MSDLDDPSEIVEPRPTPPRRRRRWPLWVGVGVLAAVALVYGAIFFYTQVLNDPADKLTTADLDERLNEPDGTDAPVGTDTSVATPDTVDAVGTPTVDGVDGTWQVTEASELGYRVKENLFGVDTEAVGRTNQITGSLTIAGTQVTDAGFDVDVASIESDDGRRDGQFRGRIMSTDQFPTASFALTAPIELGSIPAPGEQITASATGDLTLRGVTRPVTFDVTAQLEGARIGVFGNIRVVFADYDIANPSNAGIRTSDEGLLEFVLVFER